MTDDADGFKTVADELGLDQQVCKSHVKRNTEALLAELKPLAEQDADMALWLSWGWFLSKRWLI